MVLRGAPTTVSICISWEMKSRGLGNTEKSDSSKVTKQVSAVAKTNLRQLCPPTKQADLPPSPPSPALWSPTLKFTLAMMRHKGAPSWVRLNRFPVVDSMM